MKSVWPVGGIDPDVLAELPPEEPPDELAPEEPLPEAAPGSVCGELPPHAPEPWAAARRRIGTNAERHEGER